MAKQEPIKDGGMIENIQDELLRESYRNFMLFHGNVNLGFRISDYIDLKVSDVANENYSIKMYVEIYEYKTFKHKKAKIQAPLVKKFELLVKNREMDDYLFQSREKNVKPMKQTQFLEVCDKALGRQAKYEGKETLKTSFKRYRYGDICYLLHMALQSGYEFEEIIDTLVSDVDTLTKLDDQTHNLLTRYISDMEPEERIFKLYKGWKRPITRQQAGRILDGAARKCGYKLKICTHVLRKTYGYFHYKQYNNVVALMNWFNHSHPSITLDYIGMGQEELDELQEGFYIGG